jgi:hypothetical protein
MNQSYFYNEEEICSCPIIFILQIQRASIINMLDGQQLRIYLHIMRMIKKKHDKTEIHTHNMLKKDKKIISVF